MLRASRSGRGRTGSRRCLAANQPPPFRPQRLRPAAIRPQHRPINRPHICPQEPSLSGSTWLARVICNFPSSRRPSASSEMHRTSPLASTTKSISVGSLIRHLQHRHAGECSCGACPRAFHRRYSALDLRVSPARGRQKFRRSIAPAARRSSSVRRPSCRPFPVHAEPRQCFVRLAMTRTRTPRRPARNSPQPAWMSCLLVRKSRAEQDWHRALRSLHAGCASSGSACGGAARMHLGGRRHGGRRTLKEPRADPRPGDETFAAPKPAIHQSRRRSSDEPS